MRIIADARMTEKYYLIAPEGVPMIDILNAIYKNTGMRKDSFADLQVKQIFSNLFKNAVELKYYYKTYYIEEYHSFQDFLYQSKLMDKEVISSINLHESETLWELRQNLNDANLQNFMGYDNENILLLNSFLEGVRI